MSKGDYKVGWGRPPKQSQFQKGQSGNPKGRRSSASFDKLEIIERIYAEKVSITVGGKRKKVTKLEAAIRMTLQTAMQKGDIKSFERVMAMIEDQGGDWRVKWAAEAEAGAQETMAKIFTYIERTIPDETPEKVADLKRREREELDHVLACPSCSEFLLGRWNTEGDSEHFPTALKRLFDKLRAPCEPPKALPPPGGDRGEGSG